MCFKSRSTYLHALFDVVDILLKELILSGGGGAFIVVMMLVFWVWERWGCGFTLI